MVNTKQISTCVGCLLNVLLDSTPLGHIAVGMY